MELYQNRIPYSPDGIICHISSILHLTASYISQHLLYMMQCCHRVYFACTLVWPVISVANLIFILYGHGQDILRLDF